MPGGGYRGVGDMVINFFSGGYSNRSKATILFTLKLPLLPMFMTPRTGNKKRSSRMIIVFEDLQDRMKKRKSSSAPDLSNNKNNIHGCDLILEIYLCLFPLNIYWLFK